jgi:hypothetical protein
MTRTRSWTLHPLALAALVHLAGCSFVALGPPRASANPSEPVQCTAARVAPALDTLAAVGAGLFSLWYYALSSSLCSWAGQGDPNHSCPVEPLTWGGLAVTGAYAVSAGYGYHQTNACSTAKKGGSRCDPATGMGCGPLGLPSGTAPPSKPPYREP